MALAAAARCRPWTVQRQRPSVQHSSAVRCWALHDEGRPTSARYPCATKHTNSIKFPQASSQVSLCDSGNSSKLACARTPQEGLAPSGFSRVYSCYMMLGDTEQHITGS